MTFLPVVARELRVASRRRYTYWTRSLAGLACIVVCAFAWFAPGAEPEHARGRLLFQLLASLSMVYSLFAGIAITSDSLSQEKREGTLGLLFLTDLRGYDVVLGKLTATSLNATYRLFSTFPLLAVPLLMGGITWPEVARMAAVLTNTLLFSLSAGILASVLSRDERRSMAAAFAIILASTVAPAALGWMLWERTRPFNLHWLCTSAVLPATLSGAGSYALHPRDFWLALASTHALAWMFVLLSSLLVPRVWQDRPAASKTAGRGERWRRWRFGHGPGDRPARGRVLDVNPVLWLAGRDRLPSLAAYCVLGILALAWLALFLKFGRGWLDPTLLFLAAYSVHTLLKLWLASEASRTFTEDRRTGALELLLSTPLTVQSILVGQLSALERHFGGPVRLVLLVDIAMFAFGTQQNAYDSTREWIWLWAGAIGMFLLDLYALAWVGLWLSLRSTSGLRAFRGVIGRVLLLPWALFLFVLVPVMSIRWTRTQPSEWNVLGAGCLLSIVLSATFMKWAQANLEQRFRDIVGEQFLSRKGENGPQVVPLPRSSSASPALSLSDS